MKISSHWCFVDLVMLVGAVLFAGGVFSCAATAAAPLFDFVWSEVCVRGSSIKVAGVMCWGVSVVKFAVVGMASFDLV